GNEQAGPFTMAFELSGHLDASLESNRRSLIFRKLGIAAVRYGELAARDKVGRDLPAWFEIGEQHLLLRVCDRDAEFPVDIGPIVQQAQLIASSGGSNHFFGASVGVSGDTVMVGANLAAAGTGEAYVFVKPPSGWNGVLTEAARLRPSDNGLDGLGRAI